MTLRCNFHCSFCGFARSLETSEELSTEKAIELLRIIKQSSPCIYFTGGEPLLRSDIVEVLRASKQLGFTSVSLNTNLSLMHKRMESLKYIDNLVVSLNQMDDKRIASTKGVSVEMVQRVKENLATCVKLREAENFSLTINCVATDNSIEDAFEVMDYCFQNNISFAIVPAELEYGYLDKALVSSSRYKDLIKFIIQCKKEGLPIFNSYPYLDQILNIRGFTCYPTLLPHVYPNGQLFYPCQPMRRIAGNIFDFDSYEKCLREGIREYGAVPKCKDRCYIACYVESSMAMKHPLRYLREKHGFRRGP
ncbi:GTP 3',8-cyclase [subsurface metagenome]